MRQKVTNGPSGAAKRGLLQRRNSVWTRVRTVEPLAEEEPARSSMVPVLLATR